MDTIVTPAKSLEDAKERLSEHFIQQRYFPQEHYPNVINLEGKYLGPYIPYIGKYYFATKPKILIYGMAQNLNLNKGGLKELVASWLKTEHGGLYRQYLRVGHTYVGPYDCGYLKIIAALSLNAYPSKQFQSSNDISDLLAVTNLVKFSFYKTGKKGTSVDVNPPKTIYDVMWDKYVSYEIEVLKPDLIIASGHDVATALRTGLKKTNKQNNVIRIDFPGGQGLAPWRHKKQEQIANGINPLSIQSSIKELIKEQPDDLNQMKLAVEQDWCYFDGMRSRIEKRVKEITSNG